MIYVSVSPVRMVTPVGLEPDIAGVRGRTPKPLEEGANMWRFNELSHAPRYLLSLLFILVSDKPHIGLRSSFVASAGGSLVVIHPYE